MERIKPYFYVRGSGLNPKPLDEGTALYCRAWISNSYPSDFRWDHDLGEWCESDYLGRLLSRGEPDIEQIDESEIPSHIGWPKF